MSQINMIFNRIENLTDTEGQCVFISVLKDVIVNENQLMAKETFESLKSFLQKIFDAIDELAAKIKNDDTILISVKNQKLLRSCFQMIVSLGVSPSLIPGLGINLTKRSQIASKLPRLTLSDEQKYEMLINCTDFFTRSYSVPVLKNIIISLHLSDYLASLIQLSFAPFKKPGTYNNFVMTQEMYDKLTLDRQKYIEVYNHLTSNCFQPILMKELLVLQSGNEPVPPMFVKRIVSKELSQRLLTPGGLLSLIRCFIESYDIDTGFEWRKIDMICRIVSAKHGTSSESDYLTNICSQLKQILCLNNTHYLTTAVACILSLNDKYSQAEPVQSLVKEIFKAFDYDYLVTNYNLPGTIVLSPQEVEHKVNILHACVCYTKLDWPVTLLTPNLFMIFLIGSKSTKNEELKIKLKDIVIKTLEKLSKEDLCEILKTFLFGKNVSNSTDILVEEYDAGIALKCVTSTEQYSKDQALLFFMDLFKAVTDEQVIVNIFELSLKILTELSSKRQMKYNKDLLVNEDDAELIDDIDQQYAIVLHLLSQISTSPKIISSLKKNPLIVSDFIEYFILKDNSGSNGECTSIALVLLNTILSNSDKSIDFERKFINLVPVLRRMCDSDSNLNSILCQEALSLISSGNSQKKDTPCERAITDVFDDLLPVRAHGVIQLTKLIDEGDPETISKKHYIFCIFQEQLKHPDSYLYLAAVNGLASLCLHCTEDVLHVLCKEFLEASSQKTDIETKESQNRTAELKMKIGDVVVKVTRKLGEMASVHKATLLNTMLCACRDEDPLIRTSALSNLAEIALVLHYKMGTIIYEVLLCIWSIIETDKAVECRRAAVMVITSLIKGLGKETLLELKENLLPIYRTLKNLYRDNNEDSVVRLHAQLALEELNDVVNQFLFPDLKMEKQIFVLDKPQDVFK
ncbi:transport and golgi organization 6 [Anticarsia gemmatalis]|uniref:transport and golgi organization 6 n=1 Tax=Anticarsia gemmatalis TaxID=129554 RepID=UPI003F75BCFD